MQRICLTEIIVSFSVLGSVPVDSTNHTRQDTEFLSSIVSDYSNLHSDT